MLLRDWNQERQFWRMHFNLLQDHRYITFLIRLVFVSFLFLSTSTRHRDIFDPCSMEYWILLPLTLHYYSSLTQISAIELPFRKFLLHSTCFRVLTSKSCSLLWQVLAYWSQLLYQYNHYRYLSQVVSFPAPKIFLLHSPADLMPFWYVDLGSVLKADLSNV